MPKLPPKLHPTKPKQRVAGSADLRPAGSAWQKRRLTILSKFPLCVYCLAEGFITPSKIVDHIMALSLGGDSEDNNLTGACKDCNDKKRKLEQAWQQAGWSTDVLAHAVPVTGSLAWYLKIAREAQ